MKRGRLDRALRRCGQTFGRAAFARNPVAVGALGLFPVAAGAYQLQNAVALTLLTLAVSAPASVLFSLLGRRVPAWLRPGLALAAAGALFLPAQQLVNAFLPAAAGWAGLFAPVAICNSAVLSRLNEFAPQAAPWEALADALGNAFGFGLAACAVALLREWLATGAVWGFSLEPETALQQPFFGFLLLGFLAAGFRAAAARRARRSAKRRKEDAV